MSRQYEGLWWVRWTLEDGKTTHSVVTTYEDCELLIAVAARGLQIEDQRVIAARPVRYVD